MGIEDFFLKSVGEWNSMRSSHSLAFQEFEEIRSTIKIVPIKNNESKVIKLLKDYSKNNNEVKTAFLMSWKAKSEWDDENIKEDMSGESLSLIHI